MIFQQIAVALVVGAAILYLVWKFLGGRRAKGRQGGPDVPIGRLVRRQRKGSASNRSKSS